MFWPVLNHQFFLWVLFVEVDHRYGWASQIIQCFKWLSSFWILFFNCETFSFSMSVSLYITRLPILSELLPYFWKMYMLCFVNFYVLCIAVFKSCRSFIISSFISSFISFMTSSLTSTTNLLTRSLMSSIVTSFSVFGSKLRFSWNSLSPGCLPLLMMKSVFVW